MSRRALFLAAALFTGLAGLAHAQPGPGGRGPNAFNRLDSNADGRITREEYQAVMRQRFDAADANRDGGLSAEELPAFMRPGRRATTQPPATAGQRQAAMIRRLDTNGDGRLSFEELQPQIGRWFTRRDTDGDGTVTAEEYRALRRAAPAAPAAPRP